MTRRDLAPDQLSPRADWATCPACGKRGYAKRSEAARARRGHRQRKNLGIYRCHLVDDGAAYPWHLGHKPRALKTGEIGRADVPTHRHHDPSPEHELADRFDREDHQ